MFESMRLGPKLNQHVNNYKKLKLLALIKKKKSSKHEFIQYQIKKSQAHLSIIGLLVLAPLHI
ncbi:hypothetical protein LguiA_019104 [Lonicera macranthoides]